MVPQDKICTTGGYNSCPPHLNPSTTILLSYFRVEQDFSHFILFLSSLLSRWASRHHKLQYAFYAASRCLQDPFLPRLKQGHTLPPVWIFQQLRLFKFNSTVHIQSQRKRQQLPPAGLDMGLQCPRACDHWAAGHWSNCNPTLWNATVINFLHKLLKVQAKTRQSKPALPSPESHPSTPLLNLECILKRHRTKLTHSYSEGNTWS